MSKSGYSKSQVKFIMNMKKRGKTYNEIAQEFGRKFGVKKSPAAMESTFRRHKNDYDLDGLKTHVEIKAEVMEQRMLDAFLNLVEERNYIPIQAEFCSSTGYTIEQIKRYFKSFEDLEKAARASGSRVFKDIIDETLFSEEVFKTLREEISQHKRFVVTTAVTGCQPHEEGLAALQNYCKRNDAKLLILPCSDPAHTKEHKYNFSLSHKLPSNSVVFRDVSLNSNIFLSTIKLSAKHINPLTGLSRIGQNKGSFIYASPKQTLEHVAVSNKKAIPRALMTTGAITVPDYRTDMYMSERTAYIAEHDHVLGAVIVEIKDNKVFFYRQIQIDSKTGSFTDVNKQYFADGSVKKVSAQLAQMPDWHVLETDQVAKRVFKEVVEKTTPEFMTLEDFFDGNSVSHHDRKKVTTQARKASKGLLSLDKELKANQKEIDDLCTWPVKKLIFKYGNHEDFLKRWLEDGMYVHEPHNHYTGICLAKAFFEGHNPYEFAMREMFPIDDQDKVQFLDVNDSFVVNDVENAVHGHLGPSGKRNPGLAGLEKAYGKSNTGHTHSAAILRGCWRVGTASKLQLSYNDGPSGWTQTMLLQHMDGSRQLITNIFGEWCLPDILK